MLVCVWVVVRLNITATRQVPRSIPDFYEEGSRSVVFSVLLWCLIACSRSLHAPFPLDTVSVLFHG